MPGSEADRPAARERLVVAAFAANAVLAGGNSVAIRFSNRELAPLWGATLRFAVASAILLPLMALFRLPIPRSRALKATLVFGLLQFAGAFGLGYYAFVHVHAGLGQTILALVPLATLLLAAAQRQARMSAAAVGGTVLALAGVAIIARGPLEEDVPILSVLALLGAVLCFAQAAIVVRKAPPVHPVAMNAVGMSVSTLVLFAGALLGGERLQLPGRPETWFAVVYVAAVGSVAVFLLFVYILHNWSAPRAAYVMVLIPFVTVTLSAWLDNEPLRWSLLAGGALILGGVYVGALRRRGLEPAGASNPPGPAETAP